jgi:cyanuric acid amidohydrolase
MAFSGTEVDCVEAIVFGTRKGGDPDWAVTQVILRDLLDIESALKIRKPMGFEPLVILFKAGIAPSGKLRGRRTTVFSGDLPPDKHLRAAASGFIGAAFGYVDSFISGGAEHQGSEGSCLCTIIWKRVAG